MIKAFVFDIGNVVWEFKPCQKKFFINLSALLNLPYEEIYQRYSDVYQGFETDELDILDWLKTLNPQIESKSVELVFEKSFGDDKFFKSFLNLKLIDLIKKLQDQGVAVLCLSNTEKFFYPYLKKHILPIFDQSLLSWQLKDRKPNDSIYQNIFKCGDWKPKEVVFIDDKEMNVEAAKNLGINSILYQDFNQLEKEIRQYQQVPVTS
jgi:HAD superfamily hydrolase (TIGR01509 family)